MSQYLFKAKSREGFTVKLASEALSNYLKYPPFKIDQRGIYLRATDQNREVLIDIEWSKENFTIFKAPKPLYFIVNSTHFYRLLKTIKKKDAVTMFINEQSPMQLGIRVEQNDEKSDKVTTFINITYMQPEDIELPDGYGEPIIITSKHFQKLKTLHSIGAEMKVTILNGVIKFFVNGKNLFSREISIGEEDDAEDDTSMQVYSQTFTTAMLTQLTKCAGQSGNVLIYYHEELPLHIKMKTGTLGNLSVYVKSKELIEMEQAEEEPGLATDLTIGDGDVAEDETEEVEEEEEQTKRKTKEINKD